MRLIDADEFIKGIEDVPIIEIVQCKDCKWRGNAAECPMCHYINDNPMDMRFIDRTSDAGFCWAGERKNENATD